MTNFTVKLNSSNTGLVVKPTFASIPNPATAISIKNQVMKITGNTEVIAGSNMIMSQNNHVKGIIVQPHLQVSANSSSVVTIKNQVMTVSSAANRLDHLQDVVEGSDPIAGSTLVYHKDNDKYEVQRLQISDVDGPLDGGNF